MSLLLLTICVSLVSHDSGAEAVAGFEVGGITNEAATVYLFQSGFLAGTELGRVNALLKSMDDLRVDGVLPQRRGELVFFDHTRSKLSTASYIEVPKEKLAEIRTKLLTEEGGWEAEEASDTTIKRSRYLEIPKLIETADGKIESRMVRQDRPVAARTYRLSDPFVFWSNIESLTALDLVIPHARSNEPNAICWVDLAQVPDALRLRMLSQIKRELQAAQQAYDEESVDQWMIRAAWNYLCMVVAEDLAANHAKLVGSAQLNEQVFNGQLTFRGGRSLNALMKQMKLREPSLKKYIPADACVAGWFGADLRPLDNEQISSIVNDLSHGSGLGLALLQTDEIECAFWSVEADTTELLVVLLRVDNPQKTLSVVSKVLPAGWDVQLRDNLVWITNSKAEVFQSQCDTSSVEPGRQDPEALACLSFDLSRPVRLSKLLDGLGFDAYRNEVHALDFVKAEAVADGQATAKLSITSNETNLRIVSGSKFAIFVTALSIRLLEQTHPGKSSIKN